VPTAGAPRRAAMGDRALLWLVAGYLSLQPLSTDLYLGSLPHLAHYFGAPVSAAQLTLTIFVTGVGLAQLVAGPLADRFGRRPVALGGCAVYLLASLACAGAPDIRVLVAARLLQALGCCCVLVAARTIVRDRYDPASGAAVIARASSLLALVPLFGPVLGGYTQVWFGWRAAFVIHALFALLLLAASLRWLRETHARPDPQALRVSRILGGYARIAARAEFWRYALPGALTYAAIFVFIAGSSFAFIDVLGVPTERYGLCFAFAVCGYLGGTLLCRRLIARLGLVGVLRVGTLLTMLGGVGLFLAVRAGVAHWAALLAAQFTVMAAHGLNQPCAQAGVVAPFGERAGAAAGLFGFVTMVSAFGIGTLLGLLHEPSLRPLAGLSAAIGVCAFLVAWLPRGARPRPA
jgi:DHA1 family bicyclomycin/chloramphenicol resistance-like MFS transporter